MQTYLRWRNGEPRLSRVFPPLDPDHPAYGQPCIGCGWNLDHRAPVQLIALGPGDDEEDQERHRAGRWYSATAWLLHAACLGSAETDVQAPTDAHDV